MKGIVLGDSPRLYLLKLLRMVNILKKKDVYLL